MTSQSLPHAKGSALSVREAGPADISALTRLINTAFAVERSIYDGERIDPEQCANLLATGKVLLAEENASLIGCIYLELRNHSGYLGLLSVTPLRQNQGIGRFLLTTGEDWFRDQGRKTTELQIINLRTELLDFYRRHGYRESGTAPFPADVPTHIPCHFIRMTKTL
jgi:GNAT superfamily N-acetyltransferase